MYVYINLVNHRVFIYSKRDLFINVDVDDNNKKKKKRSKINNIFNYYYYDYMKKQEYFNYGERRSE